MFYKNFVGDYVKVTDTLYEGYILNSDIHEVFQFSNLSEFEEKFKEFIDKNLDILMAKSVELEIDLDIKIFNQLKILADAQDVSIKEYITTVIINYLSKL